MKQFAFNIEGIVLGVSLDRTVYTCVLYITSINVFCGHNKFVIFFRIYREPPAFAMIATARYARYRIFRFASFRTDCITYIKLCGFFWKSRKDTSDGPDVLSDFLTVFPPRCHQVYVADTPVDIYLICRHIGSDFLFVCHTSVPNLIIYWRPSAHCLFDALVYLLLLFGYSPVSVAKVPSR